MSLTTNLFCCTMLKYWAQLNCCGRFGLTLGIGICDTLLTPFVLFAHGFWMLLLGLLDAIFTAIVFCCRTAGCVRRESCAFERKERLYMLTSVAYKERIPLTTTISVPDAGVAKGWQYKMYVSGSLWRGRGTGCGATGIRRSCVTLILCDDFASCLCGVQ